MIRSGTGQHSGITAYTAARLSDAGLTILGWLGKPPGPGARTSSSCPRRGGPQCWPMSATAGRDRPRGLISWWCADEFASRYSHWVSEVRVR
jgi:hypothetical protein